MMDITVNNMKFHAVHYERSLGKLYAFVTVIDIGASGKGTGKKYYWGEVSDFDIEAEIQRVMERGGKWPRLTAHMR
jgi:hypothetical protein